MSFPSFTRERHICSYHPLPGRDIYVLPVLYQGWTYMSFTREVHICPSRPLPGRDIYVLPILHQGGTYMSFPSLTREGHICPSSPIRIRKEKNEEMKKLKMRTHSTSHTTILYLASLQILYFPLKFFF